MDKKEFNKLYNEYLKEFNSKFLTQEKIHTLLLTSDFKKKLESAQTVEEKILEISYALVDFESQRTNNLVSFMLKKFLDIKD